MLIKTRKDIEGIYEGGRILARITEELADMVKPGVSTWEIDILAEERIRAAGGVPAFKGYRGSKYDPPFPGTICASINSEVVHGIPRKDRLLKTGDLFKLDIGMRYKNLYTDMARTFPVGNISREAQALLDATRESLEAGVRTIHAGSSIREYAIAVQRYAESFGYGVVRDLVGHGVGHAVHEAPQIPNYADTHLPHFIFEENMVIALEPMVNMGSWKVRLSDDEWTFETLDGSLSAHWENTYAVTKEGVVCMTAIG